MKTRFICCLVAIAAVTSVAFAQLPFSKPSPLPGCGPVTRSITNWSQFQFEPSHSGYNPYETVLSPTTVSNLVLKWQNTGLDRGSGSALGMPVVDGVLYIGIYTPIDLTNHVYAINASNGCIIWDVAPDPNNGAEGISVINGVVYGSGGASTLFSLNAANGSLLWKLHLNDNFGMPTVTNGVVYVANGASILALNANTGAVLWSVNPGTGRVSVYAPAVQNGVVYFGTAHATVALNASNGDLVWQYPGILGFISPTVANGFLYIAGGDGYLYALDASNGALRWSLPGVYDYGVAIVNGVLYTIGQGSACFGVCAFNAQTGSLIWGSRILSYANTLPTVANGVIYAPGSDGKVYALDATSGAVLWSYQTDGQPVGTPPVVSDGVMYVSSVYGTVYAFGLPNPIY